MAFKYKDEWKLYQKEQKLDNSYFKDQQKLLNTWNQESAQKQMDFQKMMSDSSHQREVKDLLKAGLNPVLSANNGASTPSGAYANIDSTPLTAASQSRVANRQMRQQMIQNKMQLGNAMAIAKYQARMQYLAQKYATDMSYKLGMEGLDNQWNIASLNAMNARDITEMNNSTSKQNTQTVADNKDSLWGLVSNWLQGWYGASSSKDLGTKSYGGVKKILNWIFGAPTASTDPKFSTPKNSVKVPSAKQIFAYNNWQSKYINTILEDLRKWSEKGTYINYKKYQKFNNWDKKNRYYKS